MFWHCKSNANLKDLLQSFVEFLLMAKALDFFIGQKVHINNWDFELKKVIRLENTKIPIPNLMVYPVSRKST